MNFLQHLFPHGRQPRRTALPDGTTLASCSYQAAHDLACGLDPAQESARRQAEKAALPVRHRPYTPAGRAAYDASLAAPSRPVPARPAPKAVPLAPPVFCMDFAPAGHQGVLNPGPEVLHDEPIDLSVLVGEDCIPDDLLEAEAARESEMQGGIQDEDLYREEEAPLSAAERGEQALLAALSSELRGAVAQAAQRARAGRLPGAA